MILFQYRYLTLSALDRKIFYFRHLCSAFLSFSPFNAITRVLHARDMKCIRIPGDIRTLFHQTNVNCAVYVVHANRKIL